MFKAKRLDKTDKKMIREALKLAKDVFMEFDAPDFTKQGVKSFLRFADGTELKKELNSGSAVIYVCMEEDIICSMMCVRHSTHIGLAFTDGKHQRKGMAAALLDAVCAGSGGRALTVNAAPAGYEFYRKMGFEPTDIECLEDGVIFTPMRKEP